MNDILETLKFFINYYNKNRAIGHTHAIINGVKNNDKEVKIIVSSVYCRELEGLRTLNLDNIERLQGANKAIIFDNTAQEEIFRRAATEISTLRRKIEEIKVAINCN